MITVTTAPNWFEVRVICFCYLQFFLLSITLVVIVVATIFLPMLTLAPILTFSLICFEHLYDSISFFFACHSFLGTPYTSEIVSSTDAYMFVEMVGIYTIFFSKLFENSVGKHLFYLIFLVHILPIYLTRWF